MLTLRLNAILNYIESSDTVADIGTDHGYLLEACLKKGVKFVQGVENKEGPYLRAKSNLQQHLENKKAILTLSDGLSFLDSRIDIAVIAGMGGELIRDIIDASLDTAKKLKKLILEPNIKSYELRKYLSNHHFEILDEEVVYDKDKYYEIIVIKYNQFCKPLSDIECLFGPVLLKKRPDMFINKWEDRVKQLRVICDASSVKLENLENDIKVIVEVLNNEG